MTENKNSTSPLSASPTQTGETTRLVDQEAPIDASTASPNARPADSKAAQVDGPELFPTDKILGQLRSVHMAAMGAFRKEVENANGGWVGSTLPAVRLDLERDQGIALTDDLLLRSDETRAFWAGAEARLGECARCGGPSAPGCLGSAVGIAPGVVVRLRVLGPDLPQPTVRRQLTPCSIFQEARIVRRLLTAGVPAHLAEMRLQSIQNSNPDGPHPKAEAAFEHVILKLASHRDLVFIIQGKLSREYGVALLAACVAGGADSIRYVSVPRLVREEKEAMRNRQADAQFLPLMTPDVVLLENIELIFQENPSKRTSNHWLEEFNWLLDDRRDRGLVTILTTQLLKPLKDNFPGAVALFVEKKK